MQRLKVVAAHRPPFVFITNMSSGSTEFSGMLIDLLSLILSYGNSTPSYKYDIYQAPQNAGGSASNGSWSGVVGELVSQRADVALFPLTETGPRREVIDCTLYYYDAGMALLVSQWQTAGSSLSVWAPFTLKLWVALFFTIAGVALLFWVLGAYVRWIRSKEPVKPCDSGALSERPVVRVKRGEGNPVLISFLAAAGAPERPGRSSWGVQVLYIVYCFFCLVVLSSYTASLTSSLTVRRMYTAISDLKDLEGTNAKICMFPNSSCSYFATSVDSLARRLQPNVIYGDSSSCVQWLREGVVQAFIADEPALRYIAQQQPCDTAVVGKPFGPGNLVVGLQKNSSLLPLFNAAIQALKDTGKMTDLHRKWFEERSQCESGAQLENSSLNVGQMWGAFLLLIIGIVAAFVVGILDSLRRYLARVRIRPSLESGNPQQNAISSTWMRLSRRQLTRSTALLQQALRLQSQTFRRLSAGSVSSPQSKPLMQSRSFGRVSDMQRSQLAVEAEKGTKGDCPPTPSWAPAPLTASVSMPVSYGNALYEEAGDSVFLSLMPQPSAISAVEIWTASEIDKPAPGDCPAADVEPAPTQTRDAVLPVQAGRQ